MTYPQPPHDPTRAYQPPPQQYAPPAPGQYPPPYGPPLGLYPPPAPVKKNPKWLKVAGISVIAVVALCTIVGVIGSIGGSDTPSSATKRPAAAVPDAADVTEAPAPGPTKEVDDAADGQFNLAPGKTMTITDEDGGVMQATMSGFKVHKGACGRIGATPTNGSYLIATVTIVQKKGTGFVNPFDFTFVSDSGSTDNGLAGSLSGCLKNSLGSTTSLRAGQRRAGEVAFDVKDGKGSVEYAPGGLGADTVGSWRTS